MVSLSGSVQCSESCADALPVPDFVTFPTLYLKISEKGIAEKSYAFLLHFVPVVVDYVKFTSRSGSRQRFRFYAFFRMVFAAQKMQAPKTIPTIPSRTEENVIPPAKLRIREITDRIREIIESTKAGPILSV